MNWIAGLPTKNICRKEMSKLNVRVDRYELTIRNLKVPDLLIACILEPGLWKWPPDLQARSQRWANHYLSYCELQNVDGIAYANAMRSYFFTEAKFDDQKEPEYQDFLIIAFTSQDNPMFVDYRNPSQLTVGLRNEDNKLETIYDSLESFLKDFFPGIRWQSR